MITRKRTTLIVLLTITALLVAAGIAWAAGTFPDVSEDDVHFDAIEWAAENGIVNGYTNGNFGPYDNITRGQAATMFQNYDEFAGGGDAGDCAACHDDTTLITGKQATWADSNHGMNTSFLRATSAGCAGCHSGGAFSMMVAAGQNPGTVPAGDPDPTRQGCRACHQIHETYTGADWALETVAPVELYAIAGSTFDGGKGNLCANCHQPRRGFPEPNDAGIITGISEHWGPHHGPQSATLLGVAGAGVDDGAPMLHYTGVADTCVGCHTAEVRSHTFAADIDACQACHPGAEDFDINGVQTEVQGRLDALALALEAAGALTLTEVAEGEPLDGHPSEEAIENGLPENEAIALFNWIYIAHEDKSLGVHNPGYTDAMLTAAEEALGM